MTAAATGAVLLVLPWIVGSYALYLLSLTGAFSLVAIGLDLLTGLAGQISLGHAAFFAIGAYTTGLLMQRAGIAFPLALLASGVLSAAIGALAALPALRLRNLYLAIATLGLSTVVQKTLFEWRTLTGGGYAELVAVGAGNVVAIPDDVPFAQAAIAACTIGTELNAVVDIGHVAPGERVLVTGAGGGLGMHGVQRGGCKRPSTARCRWRRPQRRTGGWKAALPPAG